MEIIENKRFEGSCKWYNPTKAFGFIYVYDLEDGVEKSIFFHKTHIRGLVPPTEGDKVNFYVKEGDRGLFCDDISMGEIGDEGDR